MSEEAIFEIWFQLNRRKEFEARYPNETMPELWSMGYRDSMLKGWMARASLHLTEKAK